jgi:hypothetical protein
MRWLERTWGDADTPVVAVLQVHGPTRDEFSSHAPRAIAGLGRTIVSSPRSEPLLRDCRFAFARFQQAQVSPTRFVPKDSNQQK